jgi:hypothetical protein
LTRKKFASTAQAERNVAPSGAAWYLRSLKIVGRFARSVGAQRRPGLPSGLLVAQTLRCAGCYFAVFAASTCLVRLLILVVAYVALALRWHGPSCWLP